MSVVTLNLEMKIIESEKGQVALIVLLVAAVTMTIGLSLSKKTVIETKVDTNEELAKQAFNTAESGIDNYLKSGEVAYSGENGVGADLSVKNVGNGSTVNFDQHALANQTINFWLVGHDANQDVDYGTYYKGTNLSICLQNSFTGALKIDYFYRNGSSTFEVKRFGYNFSTNKVHGFENVSGLSQGSCIEKYNQLTLSGASLGGSITPLLLTVKPVGSGVRFYLAGDNVFPIQGENISSNGRSGDSTENQTTSREVSVLRVYSVPTFLTDPVTGWGNVLSN